MVEPEPEPPTPAQVAANHELWPGQVALKQDIQFPAYHNGQQIGSVLVPAGSEVEVVSIQKNHLVVEFHGNQAAVYWRSTDLAERLE